MGAINKSKVVNISVELHSATKYTAGLCCLINAGVED